MSSPLRMTPEDSAFWKMESENALMHSVTLMTFEGPTPDADELRDHVAQRVPLVPHFRHRVVEIPLDLGRPMWVDDPDFDLDGHLPRAAMSLGAAGLDELVSLIVSEPLDRSRPLWQLTVVTGLPDDGWALISKVHHSMIDGLFGTEPLAVLIDGAIKNPPTPAPWNPSPMPRPDELISRTAAEFLFNPGEQYRFTRAGVRRSRRRLERIFDQGSGRPETDSTGLRGPVGSTRTWASLSLDMDPIRKQRQRFEVNTHELILALVTSGIRDLLAARDESGTGWPTVKAIVPVAVAGFTTGYEGGIAAETVELPTGESDIVGRIERLHRQTPGADANPLAINAQIGLTGFPAPALASLGLREATRRGLAEREAQVVVVNVPGPRRELTMLGRPVTGIRPAPPLAGGVRLSIGVYSYLDTLSFGVTADRRSIPDAHVVTTGIRQALDELTGRP